MTTSREYGPRKWGPVVAYVLGSALVIACAALVAAARAATPSVAAADFHSAALHEDGTVRTWGSDASGQLGLGRTTSSITPLRVTGISAAASGRDALAAGYEHVLSLQRDGTVLSWGHNFNGALGDGTSSDRSTPVRVIGLSGIAAVAANGRHSLALGSDGSVWAWGDFGPGDGTTYFRTQPVHVPGISNAVAISAGEYHSMIVRSDGSVWSWGFNESGQLGDGTTTSRFVPTQVVGLSDVIRVAAGQTHTLALKRDGTVWAWGSNRSGQLGGPSVGSSLVPRQVAGVTAARITVSRNTSFAVKADGTVLSWGSDTRGSLQIQTPTLITGIPAASDVKSEGHVALLAGDGTLWTWGLNDSGQLGHASGNSPATPQTVSGLSNIGTIAAGFSFSVAASNSGTVYAWGDNTFGQLGVEQVLLRSTPSLIPNFGSVTQVAASGGGYGQGSTIALKGDGTVWTWGGTGAVPMQVNGLSGVVQVAPGRALKSDGTLWVWGDNAQGQLGVNVSGAGSTSVPTQVALTEIRRIAAGPNHTVVARSDGTVWTWGSNEFGQLGTASPEFCSGPNVPCAKTPVQVLGVSGVIDVAAGGRHTLALRADGSVWAWGDNSAGQLGDGTLVSRSTPAPVTGLAGIVQIAAGGNGYISGGSGAVAVDGHSVARASDGTVWTWGSNFAGELGDGVAYGGRLLPPGFGSLYRRLVPGRVAGFTGAISVSAATSRTAAVKSDGTVWSWGDNEFGQVGDGTYAPRTSPVLVANETVDGPLDLRPAVPNNIPADKIPAFFLATTKSGDLNATNLSVDLKGGTASGTFASEGRFAAAYNVYVAAFIPILQSSTPWWQLDSARSWGVLSSPMAEYLRGAALDSQTTTVRADILQNMDLSRLGGTVFYVGYGTDMAEMLRAARYRDIYTVPSQ